MYALLYFQQNGGISFKLCEQHGNQAPAVTSTSFHECLLRSPKPFLVINRLTYLLV